MASCYACCLDRYHWKVLASLLALDLRIEMASSEPWLGQALRSVASYLDWGTHAGSSAANGGSSTANSSPGTASTMSNGNGGSATGECSSKSSKYSKACYPNVLGFVFQATNPLTVNAVDNLLPCQQARCSDSADAVLPAQRMVSESVAICLFCLLHLACLLEMIGLSSSLPSSMSR